MGLIPWGRYALSKVTFPKMRLPDDTVYFFTPQADWIRLPLLSRY